MVTNNAINANQKGVQMFNGAGIWTQGANPGPFNIGIAYSAGTFTVQGSDGTALSTTNPGYVTLQSKANPGRLVTILVTANQTFTDGSSGTTDNARFGLVTGVNWAQDIPFFLYAVMDDTESLINFMISRNPCATTSPASTGISKTGGIINVNQADFFSLGDITVTSYDSNPCICIGSFRMQFTGATDSWTVQTLSNNDGIGNFNDNTVFTLPAGVNGAASGTYILENAGTVPQWSTNNMVYMIQKNGYIKYNFNAQTCSVSGVGAQITQPILPYALSSSNQEDAWMGRRTNGSTKFNLILGANISTVNVSAMFVNGNAAALTNADTTIANGNDIQFLAFYRAYTSTGL